MLLTKTTTAPVNAIALQPCVGQSCNRVCTAALATRAAPPQVSETRTLLLKLMGSDTLSPAVQWEVVSGLTPWLTINGFHVSSPQLEPWAPP